ncbi:41344_t:CDS:2, partial [Gigaspora margarita]
AEKLLLFQTYIPKLANYSLESHSLCQIHYNQIISSNLFYEHLSSLVQETNLLLKSAQKENIELCARIEQNWQYLEKQVNEAEELKKQLQQTCEEVDVFQYLYEVIEIANTEYKALFDDV